MQRSTAIAEIGVQLGILEGHKAFRLVADHAALAPDQPFEVWAASNRALTMAEVRQILSEYRQRCWTCTECQEVSTGAQLGDATECHCPKCGSNKLRVATREESSYQITVAASRQGGGEAQTGIPVVSIGTADSLESLHDDSLSDLDNASSSVGDVGSQSSPPRPKPRTVMVTPPPASRDDAAWQEGSTARTGETGTGEDSAIASASDSTSGSGSGSRVGAPAAKAHEAESLPKEIGRWSIQEEIGRGATGRVLRGYDAGLERPVAIKLLEGGSPAKVERFRQEARVCARLDHPGIVRVFEFGEYEGRPYFVMEWVDGRSLGEIVRKTGKLMMDKVIEIGIQAADALSAAHELGVIHRDIKPDNIMLNNGRVKIADFGLARSMDTQVRLTAPGAIMGTPLYMAPEQIQDGVIGPHTDIYSLACTLFFLLTGRAPFKAQGWAAVMAAHISTPFPAVSEFEPAAAPMDRVLQHMAQKRPADRPASMTDAANQLAGVLFAMDSTGAGGGWDSSWSSSQSMPDSIPATPPPAVPEAVRPPIKEYESWPGSGSAPGSASGRTTPPSPAVRPDGQPEYDSWPGSAPVGPGSQPGGAQPSAHDSWPGSSQPPGSAPGATTPTPVPAPVPAPAPAAAGGVDEDDMTVEVMSVHDTLDVHKWDRVREFVIECLEDGVTRFVLDLSTADGISGATVGVMIQFDDELTTAQARLMLVGVKGTMREAFDSVASFELADTVDEAFARLQAV